MGGFVSNVLVGTAVLSLKYPIGGSYVEVGYTEEGVSFEYTVTRAEVRVEEKTYPIKSVIDTEGLKISANLAEATLQNLYLAMAGATKVGNVITIGGSADNKEMSIKVVGKNPAGFARTIEIPVAVASGTVGSAFRKNLKSLIPVTFEAMESPAGNLATITDATS